MVSVMENMCFNGSGCDPVQPMAKGDADKYLEANQAVYAGYLTMDSAPGYVIFAKIGTEMFGVPGYQCHILAPEAAQDEGKEESGLFTTATLPAEHINMTGFKRPGRGEGLMDAEEVTLFRGVDPADILQGGLGDCWLLSAFAAMAEYPNALLSLFKQRTKSDAGEYEITLFNFLSRQYQTIRIDDRLPVIGGRFAPCKCAYVQPTVDGEIWTCLLEKAFATMFDNSYKTISGGVSTTAFAALCGVGAEQLAYISLVEQGWVYYQPVLDSWRPYGNSNFRYGTWPDGTPGNTPKSTDEVHCLICVWDACNYIMCANSPAGSDAEFSDQGIVQGHAYTLIGAVRNVGSIKADLLQVRNPWGKKEWTGGWSDNSHLWNENPDVAAILKPVSSEDGAFWISKEDFAANYPSIAVVFKDMGRNYEKVTNPKGSASFEGAVPGAAAEGSSDGSSSFRVKGEDMKLRRRRKLQMEAKRGTSCAPECAQA